MDHGTELHVVFGAGQVGPFLAQRLAQAGKEVRLVRRSAEDPGLDGVQFARADAFDESSVVEAAGGAAVIYHCMNPATYSAKAWGRELPLLQRNLVSAARRLGARLVVLDNLYALGRTGGAPMTEATPANPCSRKGEIRARLAREREAANLQGDLRIATGRAADFYGPRGVGTHFADRFFKPLLAGKPVAEVVNPDTPHTYHFIPDVAAGLAALGLDTEAAGVFNLPCQPAESTRDLANRLAAAIQRPVVVQRMAPWLLKVLGLGMPIIKELGEMAYQWEEPFLVDDGKFRARFGEVCASRDEAARATVAWGLATYGTTRHTA